jgi:hypothetical protein
MIMFDIIANNFTAFICSISKNIVTLLMYVANSGCTGIRVTKNTSMNNNKRFVVFLHRCKFLRNNFCLLLLCYHHFKSIKVG